MPEPTVGDEVLYHSDTHWVRAEVAVVRPNGNLTLISEDGSSLSRHGPHLHGWLTYEEAAQYKREHAQA